MEDNNRINHDNEVRLRVMSEVYDERFLRLEHSIQSLDEKLNRIIWYIMCSILIPLVFHGMHLI
jgi:hypothetical protein